MDWRYFSLEAPGEGELVLVSNVEIPLCYSLAVYTRGAFFPYESTLRMPLEITHWANIQPPATDDAS